MRRRDQLDIRLPEGEVDEAFAVLLDGEGERIEEIGVIGAQYRGGGDGVPPCSAASAAQLLNDGQPSVSKMMYD